MAEIRDRVIKELVSYLRDWINDEDMVAVEDVVSDILNPKVFPEIAVVDREAELPDNELWHKNEREFEAFCAGRNIMLEHNWVKEVKDDQD